MQCLEQEKHILRRKLSEAESERDLRVQELESDYSDLRSKLMSQVSQNRHIRVRETTERMVTKCKILHGIRANCVFCDTFRRFLASLFHVWV